MPDGTLELDSKLPLPPCRVQVTVAAMAANEKPNALRALEAILESRKSQEVLGRTKEEIDAELQAMRKEWDDRDTDVENARHSKI